MFSKQNFEGNGHARASSRAVSISGTNFVKQLEQLRLMPYKDIAGHPTIGYGHLVLPDEHFVLITPVQAENLLMRDLADVARTINGCVKVPLTQNEFDALASFTFNVGKNALLTSTLLSKLNASNYQGAAAEFLLWDRAMENGMLVQVPGLARRRRAECELFLST